MEFLQDLRACWVGLKGQRYMAPREHGFSGRHFGTHVCSTASSTDFRKQGSGYVLEWDAHPSGNLFNFARTHQKRQRSFIRVMEAVHRTRYNNRLQRHYISSAPVGMVLKEHAYHLTLATAPFGSTHGALSGFWFILQDDIFAGHHHNNADSSNPRRQAGKRYYQAALGLLMALRSLCKASLSTITRLTSHARRYMASTYKSSATGMAGLSMLLPAILPAFTIRQPSKTAFCTENDHPICPTSISLQTKHINLIAML